MIPVIFALAWPTMLEQLMQTAVQYMDTGMVGILGTFICIHLLGLGLVSAWGCMIGHNLLLFVLFTAHYFSGKWNPLEKRN